MKYSTGICTWSLQNNPETVLQTLEETGLTHLHLELAALDQFRDQMKQRKIIVSCTMLQFPQEDYSTLESIRETGGVVPDDCWQTNRELVIEAIKGTAELGVPYLSFHAGFIDHTDKQSYREFYTRMNILADIARSKDVYLLLETGQESAQDLRLFLKEMNHPALGINFDPANMLLYGKGDPVEAASILAPWIKHVHIKDAIASENPGEWGTEVPWGDGDVNVTEFFKALEQIGFDGAVAIEREAGETRTADIKLAAKRLGAMT